MADAGATVGGGEVGFISSVTQAFCGAPGPGYRPKVSYALVSLRPRNRLALLRGGATDDEISQLIGKVWNARADRYSEIRTAETVKLRKVEMSYIGG